MQLKLMKESLRIASKPPCKTINGQLRRAMRIVGLAMEMAHLTRLNKFIEKPIKFEKGGVILKESGEAKEFIIKRKY